MWSYFYNLALLEGNPGVALSLCDGIIKSHINDMIYMHCSKAIFIFVFVFKLIWLNRFFSLTLYYHRSASTDPANSKTYIGNCIMIYLIHTTTTSLPDRVLIVNRLVRLLNGNRPESETHEGFHRFYEIFFCFYELTIWFRRHLLPQNDIW